MKNSLKKNLLLCFQPINIMENRAPIKSNPKTNLTRRVSESNFVKTKDESFISDDCFTKLKKVSSCDRFLKFNSDKDSNRRRSSGRSKSARRVLKNMAKSVLFIDSFRKKGRNGKVGQDPLRSDSNISAQTEKISDLMEVKSNRKQKEQDEENKLKKTNPTISISDLSSSSTLSSSSSTSSSCSSSWNQEPETKSSWISFSGSDKSFQLNSLDRDKKQTNYAESKSSNYSYISGLILLLFSLLILVFWGKICSIVCTSTWFYFVSTSRRGKEEELKKVTNFPKEEEIQSKENQKKVIMGGFLERTNNNHHRV